MRSQASKSLPKKGDANKTSLKSAIGKQPAKKTVSPKKVKKLITKTLVKAPKKSITKDDNPAKNDDKSTTKEKIEPDTSTSGPSKLPGPSRSTSPIKKIKKVINDKKDTATKNAPGLITKKTATQKNIKKTKAIKPTPKNVGKGNDTKQKIKKDIVKKSTSKFSKAKKIIKKSGGDNAVKTKTETINSKDSSEENKTDSSENKDEKDANEDNEPLAKSKETSANEKEDINKTESKLTEDRSSPAKTSPKVPSSNQSDTPKTDVERPPKFFTSTRSPRTVDIDVKCCKTSKGNLSVSERFISMKLELNNKAEDSSDKNAPNTLVSQGPDIDVYTFTEKVDSPKNILSDFRRPINKNIGRVRPIARVKGTVIDKKSESEKKKYSPHRPIEEVVKQLKANKRSEELNQSQCPVEAVNIDSNSGKDEKQEEEDPKPIVSKSYKMVARKSSITGKPFSPIKFDERESSQNKNELDDETNEKSSTLKKTATKSKKQPKKEDLSDDEFADSKFSLNTKSLNYTSSEDSVSESNDDNDTKESSESDTPKNKTKNKKYKKTSDTAKKTSKELKELSKDSLNDLKDNAALLGEKPSKRRLKLLSMWSGPKKHRMASLNALAKVHCLYENESRTHMELGLMKTIDRQVMPSTSKQSPIKKKESKPEVDKHESTSESEYETKKEKKDDSSESSDDSPPQRSLRGVPGIRSAGKYWDPKSSTSSSEDSELETIKKPTSAEKKKIASKASNKSDSDKPPAKMKKTAGVPVKKKRNRNEVVMDLKDMVVQKRMASLNATAILAASYEKRSPKSNKDDTTSDSCSDESFSQKTKNGVGSGVKSETKTEDTKKETDEANVSDKKQKVEVIVNQDTDVTITGVYSTHHHEGFCTVSGMQYRISSTSHTQTTATANCEKEGCSREDGARYTPLSALSSMQPPAEHVHSHPHPVADIGGLTRRAGCSSAFSAPSSTSHHEPGYYQPAGPLIKETSADAERALARYHPPPHYHAPHPPVQYGAPYFPDCYNRFYRLPGSYHMPSPQSDAPMVGIPGEPFPPPQYYSAPPCYQHSSQRIPYVEYRGCSCSLNPCPKNVLIGPATGKAPTGGGPVDVPSALAPPGGAFPGKVRVCVLDTVTDIHGSGKDPPLRPEPPAADAPHPCSMPAIGGVSPKRELYDVREKLRVVGDTPGPAEALGPPSPARGSAGACAPQPPPSAPRRARLGKAMARRSLAGDDTGLLISAPPPAHHSDADDDVLAISPPICAPIDLSSSDERTPPLVDVKKENDGPTYAMARKIESQALKEHNSTAMLQAANIPLEPKTVKRRYSRPKLEIDMKDTQLEDGCKTNGIGEHVKLQKRRKVSGDHSDLPKLETITKEIKKKPTQTKRNTPKTPTEEKKKAFKRKQDCMDVGPIAKKIFIDTAPEIKPKNKSALLLDNLIRKNSIDRADSKSYSSDGELNPAKLFLSPNENVVQNVAKKTLNINNNIVESAATPVNGVRANTIAAVTQLIEKKIAIKNACKVDKVDSKIIHGSKSVLKTSTEILPTREDQPKVLSTTNCLEATRADGTDIPLIKEPTLTESDKAVPDITKDDKDFPTVPDIAPSIEITIENAEPKVLTEESHMATDKPEISEENQIKKTLETKQGDDTKVDRSAMKRCKLSNGEMKAKNVEKVVKLLVSKRPAFKTDEAAQVIEEACASPLPCPMRRRRSRRGPGFRRGRRPLIPPEPPLLEPNATPRWSNGWTWDSDNYVARIYVNNDSRMDRTARCWSRMTHASGDSVSRGDCVLLRPSAAKAQPYVARIGSMWENPEDGEMMVSLVWYYRPEHTDRGRIPSDSPDEVFASRHRDANSVACIEDKCYVLTYNEYCRYRKRLKAAEEGVNIAPSIVPPLQYHDISPSWIPCDTKVPPSISPELVLFCRKVYDYKTKKVQVPNK